MVRAGYKQTEVGVIPEDWEVKSIGEFNPFVTSGSRGWAEFYSEYGHPFIRITNLSKSSIYLDMSDIKHVSLPAKSAEGKRTKLENGDILVSITADIGIIGYITETLPVPSYINQHISLIRFAKNEANTKYIAYFLTTERVQQIFRGNSDQGAKAGINLNNIRSIKFAIPSLKEQTAIATALSDIDALITTLTELIDKKRQIKTATMQQLLTGKQRLAGFGEGKGMKSTELGEIPEDWEVSPLSLLGSFKNGINKDALFFGHGMPFVNLLDVFNKIAINSTTTLGFINSSISEQKQYDLKRGDVLFVRSSVKPSGVGLTVLLDNDLEKTTYSGFLIRFRSNNLLTHNFKKYCFLTDQFRNKLIGSSSVSANTNINQNSLKNLKLIYPNSSEEQQAIAQVLSDMDDDLNALETRLSKTKATKQGMMQELLTGRIRLI